jgi:UDP-N-acetyl-D-mannosaminuronate dehydrogenase
MSESINQGQKLGVRACLKCVTGYIKHVRDVEGERLLCLNCAYSRDIPGTRNSPSEIAQIYSAMVARY